MDYKQAYFNLFNLITDIDEKLKEAQTDAELIIISENTDNENSLTVVDLLSKSNNN